MSNKQWEIGSIIGLDDVIRWDGKVSPTELEQVINQLQAGEITVAEAQKWAESITLTLAGDARGSINIDGSGNVSLSVTVNKATQAEAESGESNTRFMTPLRTKQLVDATGLAKDSDLTSHVEDKSNPHGVTKVQVGLGNVDNVKQATKTEFDSHIADKSNPHSTTASQVGAYSKTESDNRFETPAGSQQKVNAHADLTNNPHGVTKAQVGLGSVPNNSMASQAEAEAGTSNARFMSPQRTKEAIDVHANLTDNPHSVTKTQVGLGSVPNYGVSTQAEAEAGTANNRFMTPLRVREAFDKFIETVSTALNNFMARRDNPHQVTKSQVGLGNVDNVQQAPATRTISTGTGLTGGGNLTANRTLSVDIATASEAQTGTNNTKVMTPARSKALLDTHAGLTNNPHSVTAAQIGAVPTGRTITAGTGLTGGGNLTANRTLSISTATQAEAETGTNNTKVMTPLRTKQLVEKRLRGVKFADLTEPMIFAHRGAKSIFPESSLEAFRACVDLGFPIELDVRSTSDGALVVSHYAGMGTTTNRTGAVSYYSLAGFKGAQITGLGTDFVGTPVSLQDLFVELGNKAVYIIESKTRDVAQPIVDMVKQFGLEENVLIQSFERDDLTPAIQAGLPAMYLTDTTNPITIKNDGIDWVGVSVDVNESYISSLLSSGLKVGVYSVNRRFEYDRFINLGVTAIFTDDPLWVTRKSQSLTRDSFDQLTFYHGMVGLPEGGYANDERLHGNRGEFAGKGEFGWLELADESDFTLQGWAGELPQVFTMKVSVYPKKFHSELNRWAAIQICTPIDVFDDYSTLSSGYNIVLRNSGYLQLYKKTNGENENLAQIKTPQIELDQKLQLEIKVTNNSITVTRTDAYSNNETITANDNSYRGGYLHFGRRSIAVTFGDVTIS